MNFTLTPEHAQIKDAIERVCAPFDADYWLRRDREGGFPDDFHRALADAGWLGIAMPEAYGGAGLGISEAALMMHTISATGAGLSGASAVHMNIFGLHPVVVFGTEEQKARWLPPLIAGSDKACFAVTEPNTGLNTLKLKTRAVRSEGGKGDHYVVHGQKVWISTAQVANKILLLARTTPVEECSGTEGLSLFYTDLDRST
ncbi:MAG: acyl-CoA dehydrogenase, partial [Comamonadaceae bacterium]